MFSEAVRVRPEIGNEAALVGAVLAGDMTAFASLYRIHVRAVAAAVRDNVHDPDSVADVVQDVFVKALERLATLRDHRRFGPWLLSIARHAAIDHRRTRTRGPVIVGHEAERASADPGPDVLAELNELSELVRTCVAGLPRRDATALTLVTQFGLAPADIARCLGVSPGAAKVLLHRARNRLRDALALEVLVRRNAGGCGAFEVLCDTGDLVSAARHVRSCGACATIAASEVALYSAQQTMNRSDQVEPRRAALSASGSASGAHAVTV